MTHARLDSIIAAAVAEGILPPGSTAPVSDDRPWPVTLLTALGSWLAAIPLIGVVFLSIDRYLTHGAGTYILGLITAAVAIALLRNQKLPLFVEQMTLPFLIAAGTLLGAGLFRDLTDQSAAAILAVLTCAVAYLIARNWLRILLGAVVCVFTMLSLVPEHGFDDAFKFWAALHAALGVWIVVQLRGRAVLLDWISLGWVLALLIGLAVWSGMTFMVGATMGSGLLHPHGMEQPWSTIARLGSVTLAVGAAGWIARRWPSLRTPWSAASALILIGLASLMPALGAALLILAVSVGYSRWRIATAAGICAAWIVGAFYYQTAYPLETKALWMAGAGILLGAIAMFALRSQAAALMDGALPPSPAPTGSRTARLGILLSAVAVLAAANAGIWQKETLIAQGRPVFIELGPVDPRSLMQGDYMRIAFRLPPDLLQPLELRRDTTRPRIVGQIDARGMVELKRLDQGQPLASNEIAIELTRRGNGWTVVTDAWYFKEGEAERWARARYGEFRVDANGRALLVGMRGPALEPL